MYHPAPAVKRDDFGHVETHRLVALMGALEIPCGGCDDTALLGGVDRRSGGIQRVFGAGLTSQNTSVPSGSRRMRSISPIRV